MKRFRQEELVPGCELQREKQSVQCSFPCLWLGQFGWRSAPRGWTPLGTAVAPQQPYLEYCWQTKVEGLVERLKLVPALPSSSSTSSSSFNNIQDECLIITDIISWCARKRGVAEKQQQKLPRNVWLSTNLVHSFEPNNNLATSQPTPLVTT